MLGLKQMIDAAGRLMEPPAAMAFDFSQPRGEAALVPADSISWRIFKNPVSLFVGGVAAVILELAEPSVRSGVWDHSSFRRDPGMRLRRTGFAAMMTVYGPRSAAAEMIARVVAMHDKVRGTTPDGTGYHANDPRLLDWVQATASFGFIEAYSRFARPLTPAQRSQAYAEGAASALLYGATGAPRSVHEWEALLDETRPALEPSPILFEFLDIVSTAPILPRPMRPLQRMMVRGAVGIVPPDVRTRLGIDRYRPRRWQLALLRTLARTAERIPIRNAPPAQSALRMGLEPHRLYA